MSRSRDTKHRPAFELLYPGGSDSRTELEITEASSIGCVFRCLDSGTLIDCGECAEVPPMYRLFFNGIGNFVYRKTTVTPEVLVPFTGTNELTFSDNEEGCLWVGPDMNGFDLDPTRWKLTPTSLSLQIDSSGTALSYSTTEPCGCLCTKILTLDCPPPKGFDALPREICVTPWTGTENCGPCQPGPDQVQIEIAGNPTTPSEQSFVGDFSLNYMQNNFGQCASHVFVCICYPSCGWTQTVWSSIGLFNPKQFVPFGWSLGPIGNTMVLSRRPGCPQIYTLPSADFDCKGENVFQKTGGYPGIHDFLAATALVRPVT